MLKQILTATLIVSAVVTASAQQDKPSPTQPSTQENKQQPSNQFNAREYTQVQSSDVPASLRTTLGGSNYKGWESGKVYRNNNGEGYYVTTGMGANAKHYYFDKEGKAVQRNTNSTSTQRTTKEGTSVSPNPSQSTGSDSTSTGSQTKPQ